MRAGGFLYNSLLFNELVLGSPRLKDREKEAQAALASPQGVAARESAAEDAFTLVKKGSSSRETWHKTITQLSQTLSARASNASYEATVIELHGRSGACHSPQSEQRKRWCKKS